MPRRTTCKPNSCGRGDPVSRPSAVATGAATLEEPASSVRTRQPRTARNAHSGPTGSVCEGQQPRPTKLQIKPGSAVGRLLLGRRIVTFNTQPRSTHRKPRAGVRVMALVVHASPRLRHRHGPAAPTASPPSVCVPSAAAPSNAGPEERSHQAHETGEHTAALAACADAEGAAASCACGEPQPSLPNTASTDVAPMLHRKEMATSSGSAGCGPHSAANAPHRTAAAAAGTAAEVHTSPSAADGRVAKHAAEVVTTGEDVLSVRKTRSGRCYSLITSSGAATAAPSLHRPPVTSCTTTEQDDCAGGASTLPHGDNLLAPPPRPPSHGRPQAKDEREALNAKSPPGSIAATDSLSATTTDKAAPTEETQRALRVQGGTAAAAAAAAAQAGQANLEEPAAPGSENGAQLQRTSGRGSLPSASACSSVGDPQDNKPGQGPPSDGGEQPVAWQEGADSPATATSASHIAAGLPSTPRPEDGGGVRDTAAPSASQSSADSGLEWSDLSVKSWSNWRIAHGDFGIARLPPAKAHGTPDNTQAAGLPGGLGVVQAALAASSGPQTPRRGTFLRCMTFGSAVPASEFAPPAGDAFQAEAEGYGEGCGNGGARSVIGSPHAFSGRRTQQRQRRVSADQVTLHRDALLRLASGHKCTMDGAVAAAASSPCPGGITEGKGLLDLCSPSKRQRTAPGLGSPSVLGHSCPLDGFARSSRGPQQGLRREEGALPKAALGFSLAPPSGADGNADADHCTPLATLGLGAPRRATQAPGSSAVPAARVLPLAPLLPVPASAQATAAMLPPPSLPSALQSLSRPATIALPPALVRALIPPAAPSSQPEAEHCTLGNPGQVSRAATAGEAEPETAPTPLFQRHHADLASCAKPPKAALRTSGGARPLASIFPVLSLGGAPMRDRGAGQ